MNKERELLLLGLIRTHEMHGYQLNELIDRHLGVSVQLKKPTTYRLLAQMTDEGWIAFTEAQEGNRPPRRVYAITSDGEATFQRLLRESLAGYRPIDFLVNIGLMFLDEIPTEEAVPLLEKRRAAVESLLQAAHAHGGHQGGSARMLANQLRHLSTEADWLDKVITELQPVRQERADGREHALEGNTALHPHPGTPSRDHSK